MADYAQLHGLSFLCPCLLPEMTMKKRMSDRKELVMTARRFFFALCVALAFFCTMTFFYAVARQWYDNAAMSTWTGMFFVFVVP
jgi:fatty acid desaturase